MGMSADELMAMRDEGDDRRVQDAFQEANCRTFVWRSRAKMDNYQDQQRFVLFFLFFFYPPSRSALLVRCRFEANALGTM